MLRTERGSAILITLMVIFILTLFTGALFDLGVIESRLVLADEASLRAFEVAQTGIERVLYQLLYMDFCAAPDCSTVKSSPSWADGSLGPAGAEVSFPVNTSQFVSVTLANNKLSPGTLGEVKGEGSYSISLRNLTKGQAETNFGLTCANPGDSATTPCPDVILIRSMGTFKAGTMTSTRTIQMVARATNTSPLLRGGITAAASSGTVINGNVRLAGSLHIVGCGASPCAGLDDVSLSGNARIQNSYDGLPDEIQRRILRLPKVCLSTNLGCADSDKVETLTSTVRVAAPITSPAIALSGTASIGQSASGGYVSYTYNSGSGSPETIRGKGNVDGIFVANGCQQADCSDNFGGNQGARNVYSDNGPTNPYDMNPAPALPTLTNYRVSIVGRTYDHYACTTPCGSGTEFFVSHAFTLNSGPAYNAFTSTDGLRASTPDFTQAISFTNPADPSGTPPNRSGCIKWAQSTSTLSFVDGDCASTTNTTGSNPLMIFLNGPMRIQDPVTYKGGAVLVASGNVRIDQDLAPPLCSPCPAPDTFPKLNMLSLATPGSMLVGTVGGGPKIMAFLYAGGQWSTSKQTHVIGSVMAQRFDLGSQVPRFWQALGLTPQTAELISPSAPKKYSVSTSRWRQCFPPDPDPSLLQC